MSCIEHHSIDYFSLWAGRAGILHTERTYYVYYSLQRDVVFEIRSLCSFMTGPRLWFHSWEIPYLF